MQKPPRFPLPNIFVYLSDSQNLLGQLRHLRQTLDLSTLLRVWRVGQPPDYSRQTDVLGEQNKSSLP